MTRFLTFYRRLAVIQTILTALLAMGCLALTGLLLDLFGLTNDGGSQMLMRAFGASLLYVALMHWLTRRTDEESTGKAVCTANVVEDGILCVLATIATLGGVMHATGWILVAAFGAEVLINLYALSLLRSPNAGAA